MPDLTLNLEVSDVDGRPIVDPTVVVRLARSDGSSAAAWRVAFRGQRESLSLNGAPAGFALILRLTPSRYHDIQVVSRVQDGQVRPASGDERLIAPRRSSEWIPSFTPWAALPAAFDDFRRVLDVSPQFRLGRTSNPEPFFGVNYDAVDPADESRVLAKLSLLNLYSRVSVEVAPTTGQPWFTRVRELLLATRERFIAEVDETCLATVHTLAAKAQGGYHRAKHELHIANFEEIPGVSQLTEMASVKTKEAKANLQFTVTRAIRHGRAVCLLDADIDENGALLLHTFDLIKHAFTGGTHPVDVHEALRLKFPGVAIGCLLEPRVGVPAVTVRVVPPTPAVAPPMPPAGVPGSPIRRIAVLGDSVPWGQGLLQVQKIHTLVGQAFSNGPSFPATTMAAHSGAIIGVGSTIPRAAVDGEVPRAHPTCLEQCAAYPADEAAEVDLVIVNGGINDVDIRFILNPFTDPDDLAGTTTRACGPDLTVLLRSVARRFSRARIVVLEYYPVLSAQSRFSWGMEFLAAVGVPVNPALMAMPTTVMPPIWGRIVENCHTFHVASSAAIRATVAALDAEFPNRFEAVDPGFADENAALAPQAWLFGINWDLSPQDPMAPQRRLACDVAEIDPFRREQCYRASAGHPNALGAHAFATAIVSALAVGA